MHAGHARRRAGARACTMRAPVRLQRARGSARRAPAARSRACARPPTPRRPGRAGGGGRSRPRASRVPRGASVSGGRVRSYGPARSLREHGLRIGALEPGPAGSIADVAGVRVGHVTVVRDEPDPPAGRGVARSGVTAILPGEPGTLCGGAAPGRRGGAQRRRGDDRLARGPRVGPARDAGLPDRDDVRRARLRRRGGGRRRGRPGGGCRRGRDPGGGRMRRQLAERRARGAGRGGGRGPGAGGRAGVR